MKHFFMMDEKDSRLGKQDLMLWHSFLAAFDDVDIEYIKAPFSSMSLKGSDLFICGEAVKEDDILWNHISPNEPNFLHRMSVLAASTCEGGCPLNMFNHASDIVRMNSKMMPFIIQANSMFPHAVPETKTFMCRDAAAAYILSHSFDAGNLLVIKGMFGFGGNDVLLAKNEGDAIVHSRLMIARQGSVQIQPFIDVGEESVDTRIFLCDGEIAFVLDRTSSRGNLCNLKAGGRSRIGTLTSSQKRTVKSVLSLMDDENIFYMAMDMIGDHVTECNVESPGAILEYAELSGINPAIDMINRAIQRVL